VIIRRAGHLYDIEEENYRLHAVMEGSAFKLSGIFGQCPPMLNVFSTIEKVSSTDVPILVTGESGTGKELVARAVHSLGLRKDGPFVPINCGAIPYNLLESELFGHERGAFTGANTQVYGKVEYAHNGTLFLDEISELSPNLQVKLLRFLQEKAIQRVGGRENIAVNARIIAASNTDILSAIKEDRFREDLYYRIGVITIHIPPLRERGGDILLLANLFLKRSSGDFSKKIKGFSSSSVDLLTAYDWPGNVRELENRIQRAVIMAESSLLEPYDLGFAERPATRDVHKTATLKEARNSVEKELLIEVFERYKGNMTKIAQALDISRPTLYDLLKKHGPFETID
jgi:two-component system NtrC family response regulator